MELSAIRFSFETRHANVHFSNAEVRRSWISAARSSRSRLVSTVSTRSARTAANRSSGKKIRRRMTRISSVLDFLTRCRLTRNWRTNMVMVRRGKHRSKTHVKGLFGPDCLEPLIRSQRPAANSKMKIGMKQAGTILSARLGKYISPSAPTKTRPMRPTISHPLVSSNGRESILLVAAVSEGEQFRLGEVTFQNESGAGALSIDQATLRDQLNLRDGDLLDADMVRDAISKIQKLYANKGYSESVETPLLHLDRARPCYIKLDHTIFSDQMPEATCRLGQTRLAAIAPESGLPES
jgi:hypothetical protein